MDVPVRAIRSMEFRFGYYSNEEVLCHEKYGLAYSTRWEQFGFVLSSGSLEKTYYRVLCKRGGHSISIDILIAGEGIRTFVKGTGVPSVTRVPEMSRWC